jgi:hypothetical protein
MTLAERSAGVLFTNCRRRLYLREEDEMRQALGTMVALAGLVMVAATSHAAERERDAALTASVRGCTRGEVRACNELASDLATRLGAVATADHSLGLRLGTAAARAVARPDRMVAGVAESCRAGLGQACVTLANVLDQLFTGDDVRLERSTDRLLAQEIAVRVMATTDDLRLEAR